jgi:hypothetical protein
VLLATSCEIYEQDGTVFAQRHLAVAKRNPESSTECFMNQEDYKSCIEACIECAQACEHCATACLAERDVKMMVECIRLDRDCAEMCFGAAAFMSRDSRFAQQLCAVCAEVCDACGAECRKHKMDHCQECADACEGCAEECRHMSGANV